MGKSSINGSFSMAMLNNQMVVDLGKSPDIGLSPAVAKGISIKSMLI